MRRVVATAGLAALAAALAAPGAAGGSARPLAMVTQTHDVGAPAVLRTLPLGGHTRVVATLPHGSGARVSWSPDGRRLAVDVDHVTAGGLDDLDVEVVDAVSGRRRRVTHGPAQDRDPAWSPDGSRIAFLSHRSRGSQLVSIAPDGSHRRALTADRLALSWPAWSPDGRRLVVVRRLRGVPWLVVVTSGRPGMRPLTHAGFPARPAWSPDGRRIAYEGGGGIWVVGADGRGAHRIRAAGRSVLLHAPAWSPDGRTLLVVHQEHRSALAALRVDDGALRLVSPLFAFVGGQDWARR